MNSWSDLVLLHGNEGARFAFESACLLVLSTKFNNENVQGIRIHQGDGGIDVYVGLLGVEPVAVYQCKFFLNGIDESQKEQIRKSFRTASKSERFELKSWHLCLPQDLTLDEAAWFDGWSQKKESVIPKRVSPMQLLRWAEEANIANIIFQRKDSQNLEEILSLVRGTGKNDWRAIVEAAEADSSKIIMTLIRNHVRNLNGKYPERDELARRALAGDRDAICHYTKSVPVSNMDNNEKVWFFNYQSDFTGEPILHRFIRRYKILVDMAKVNGMKDALSTTEFYTTYKLIISPFTETLREAAFWPRVY